ncbi:trigger factor [Betaproteobacteria bacterium]|nr:trigger factor [Betaproteobacteria bacterium]GHU44281.1 trigger factor [Betaproteobacteria bacterium]
MENTAPNNNPLERRLNLSVPVDALKSATDERLKRMSRNVKMPGFRPGKVPFSIVRQQHGAEAYGEALNEALSSAFGEAVSSQKLNVAGYPRIEPKAETENSATALEFSAIFEVYPEFTPGDLSVAEVERPTLEVTDAEVNKTIDILRQQRVRYHVVDRGAAEDDRVVIDFLGKKDGEPFQGGQANDYPFVLGKKMMLSDFEAAVKGLKAGESKTFNLTFPEDYFSRDMAGQTVEFAITVKQVMVPTLPEIDAEFARSMGVADGDVSKMRAEIEGNLKREVKKRIEAKVKDQVMDALLAANPIPVPNALIEMEVQRLMQEARQNLEQRGMKAQNIPIQPEWFAERAKRRVSLGLIFAEVVKVEQLQAKPEQVKALVEEAAETYEDPSEVVKWYYANPDDLANVEAVATENNVVAWALERAKVTDKAVVFEDLMGQQGQQATV